MLSLLSFLLEDKEVTDTGDLKAVTCPHYSEKGIRANDKLKGIQRYVCNGCNPIIFYN